MSNRTVEAVLRLSSKLGNMKAFTEVSDRLARVDRQAKAYNRTQMALTRGADQLAATLMRVAGPAALGALGYTSLKTFASIERRMERIGINAEASAEQTKAAFGRVTQVADALKVPIDNVVEGLENLVASGKTLDEALAFLPSVAGTAHAAGASFGDMATTADAIQSSLGIAADQMERAFDILAKGGKEGKFELKDMAAELPSLAPAFAALGYDGVDGLKRLTAAMQTVRRETGSSSEAATALMDVLSKIGSETVSNNFKKFGVDIREEMAKARKEGEDTLEAFIRLSRDAVQGDMSKLPQLFTDKQMLAGMRALMNHTEEFAELMRTLGDASGTVRTDLNRLADDAQGAFDRMGNSWEKLKKSIGEGLVGLGAVDAIDSVSDNIDYATAVNAGLEKSGVHGFVDRSQWGITHDQKAKNGMAWVGGYRTQAQRDAIEAYRRNASTRLEGSAPPITPPLPRGPDGMPLVGPVPPSRTEAAVAADPDFGPSLAYQYGSYGRAAERARRTTSYLTRGEPADAAVRQGVTSAVGDLEQRLDAALSSGGEKAGSAIEESGARAGEKAGSAFKQLMDSAAQSFGEAAARSFNGSVRVPSGGGVNANVGRTGQGGGDL